MIRTRREPLRAVAAILVLSWINLRGIRSGAATQTWLTLTPGELRAIETFELAGFEVELLETPDPPVSVPVYPRRRHVA